MRGSIKTVARLKVLDDTLIVRKDSPDLFTVFIDGGYLPDGSPMKQFVNAFLAFEFASSVLKEMFADAIPEVVGS